MKCYVLILPTTESKQRYQRLEGSLLAFGWKSSDIVKVYGHNAVDYHHLAEIYDVPTCEFYDDKPERKMEFDRAFSCTAGHVDIWKKIAFGHQGGAIICEDDVVFKHDPRELIGYSNTKINWLGPRVKNVEDYSVPHRDFQWLEVERFEGTHAYFISEGTARRLYQQFKKLGFCDSIDAQLGMRGIFGVEHVLCDPPIAVAVVGDHISSITGEGAAFWNADNSPGFLEGLSPTAEIPPERKIHRVDKSWEMQRASILSHIDSNETLLFIGSGDGDCIREIVDITQHDALILYDNVGPDVEALVQNNVYLSQFYYKIGIVNQPVIKTLTDTVCSPNRFDSIMISDVADSKALIQLMTLSWFLINPGGKLIVRGIDSTFNNVFNGVNTEWILQLPTAQIWVKK